MNLPRMQPLTRAASAQVIARSLAGHAYDTTTRNEILVGLVLDGLHGGLSRGGPAVPSS